jgi:hypothetical protein
MVLALAASGSLAAAATAQPMAEKAAGGVAPDAEEKPRLWWNDSSLVEKLALDAGQRAKMDAAYARYQSASSTRGAQAARAAFEAALRQGNWPRAREQLDAWMGQLATPVRALALLKIDVLSLLSDEQRKRLHASLPQLLEGSWRPRVNWLSEPPQAPAQ